MKMNQIHVTIQKFVQKEGGKTKEIEKKWDKVIKKEERQ
jgi:hypothetical protein